MRPSSNVYVAHSSTIAALPAQWNGVDEEDEASVQYVELVERLQTLDELRTELRKKVETYRALREAMQPFVNPRDDVQQNLCTKNGELELELERMRTLLARVTGRMANLDASTAQADDGELKVVDEDEKIRDLLALS